jgi:hypothetical protein
MHIDHTVPEIYGVDFTSPNPNASMFWDKEYQTLLIHFWDDDTVVTWEKKTGLFSLLGHPQSHNTFAEIVRPIL